MSPTSREPADPAPAETESPAERQQGVQVIARAAALLRALEQQPQGMSLGELARALELPRSTVQRIVDALHVEGLVMASGAKAGVRLGPALLGLAAATRFEIATTARRTLEALAKDCGETVDLSLADQAKVIFVDQIAGRHRLAAVSAVGVSFPLHCSANGKAVLAAMTEPELRKVRARMTLARSTAATLSTWPALERELDAIRKAGYAVDREEHSVGICAIAAALRSPSGELAALSIPVPTQRFRDIEAGLVPLLLKHTEALRKRLGG
ncbi:MAG TPA: IclR family transcriptional regulator [Methylibium sp.]|uniref:IclR family transcriptional regulator n=1 Tax=Methylibium sp. TaxID=2067992 RepID=UPI002DB9EF5E|nr:IclR family transcriptional regulator [Methylibium sp.]HEU4459665.1 IclR family transcriptional regulator [Methylibium sp.]